MYIFFFDGDFKSEKKVDFFLGRELSCPKPRSKIKESVENQGTKIKKPKSRKVYILFFDGDFKSEKKVKIFFRVTSYRAQAQIFKLKHPTQNHEKWRFSAGEPVFDKS